MCPLATSTESVDSAVHFVASPQPGLITEIAPGISLEILEFTEATDTRRILICTFHTISQMPLSIWETTMMRIMDKWSPGQPFYLLQDISFSGYTLTPALRAHVARLASFRPDLPTYVAVVVRQNLMTQMIQMFMSTVGRQAKERQSALFFSRQAALEWLKNRHYPVPGQYKPVRE